MHRIFFVYPEVRRTFEVRLTCKTGASLRGTLQLAVLGKPHITCQNQPLTADLVSAKGQALLIYLAVTGRSHSRTALAGLLWGDMPEETARANLRLTLSKVRKFVPEEILQAGRLEVGLADFWLDVAEFQKRLEIGDWRLGDSANLQSLLSLYRADFLEDFPLPNAPDFDEWALGQRERWRQTAVTGLTHWLNTAVQHNDPTTGIPIARKLLTIEPWHEESHRHLMHLLAASGQRSAALAQYETCRRLLADELGIEPSAETAILFEAIRDDKVPGEPLLIPSPAHPSTPSPAHNLPPQLTPFIGREAELNRLVERLQRPDYRLLTLLGEGGAGKTRLALAAADRVKTDFTDGVWFVSLVGLETAVPTADPLILENGIATAVAAAMNIIFASAEPPKSQLIHTLRGKNCLLVLDNFEPILSAAGFALELLTAAPGVTILATSREPLHLQAEAIVRVAGLALPESTADPHALTTDGIRLFAERAERTTGQEIVTAETLPDVLHLCQFVNGLPLGIELIAGWTRWLSLSAIRQGLAENVVRLETQMPDVAPRHRSIQAVFDYSWERLSPAEQQLLAQLSVFRRGFQLEAVQQVTAAIPATLFGLVDKSLVQTGANGYYRLHELLRQYAAARLTESTIDQAALYGRHASYYLNQVGQQETAIVGPRPQTALRRMQTDSENLAQAWQWACQQPLSTALSAGAGGMIGYWNFAGLYGEGEQALAAAIAAIQPLIAPSAPQLDLCRLLARLLAERSWLLYELHRLDEMEGDAQASLHWATLVDDLALQGHGRLHLGQVYWRRGEYEAASEQFQQAQKLAAAAAETILEAMIWRNLGAVAWQQGALDQAEAYAHRSWELHQQANDIRGENRSRHFLSVVALQRHDYEAVRGYLEPVLASARELGERRVEIGACSVLGHVASYQGQYEMALRYHTRERELAEELNMPWQLGSTLSNIGDTRLRLGDFAAARACYEQASTIFRQTQSANGESNVLSFMGLLACLEGRYADGRTHCETALQLAQQADSRREQAFARLFLAHNLAGLGQWSNALPTYEQAQSAWELLQEQSRVAEAQAGVALARLKLGDVAGAVTAVNDVLAYLQTQTLDGADDPGRVYLACYQVLRAAGDERAAVVLADGRTFLQNRASLIQDPAYRQMFLQNNPAHRQLAELDPKGF